MPSIKSTFARLEWERDKLLGDSGLFPPGHFYSPIPSFKQIRRDEAMVFSITLPSCNSALLRCLRLNGDLFIGE